DECAGTQPESRPATGRDSLLNVSNTNEVRSTVPPTLKEIEMIHRTSAAARVSVPPSRAGPSLMISLAAATLALLVTAIAGGQTPTPQLTHSVATPLTDSVKAHANTDTKPADSAAAANKAAAALPKWFDELAVNAFVSTAYEYNSNRPRNGANS